MPQGHLNILHPGENLLQLNETNPVNAQETGIVRGSAIVKDTGEWRRATDSDNGAANTPGLMVYWALQDQAQPDVGFAKVLNAVPCTFPMLLETDQYDSRGSFPVGGYLMCCSTGLVTDHTDDKTAVGVVKAGPGARWSNDRLANTTYGGAQRTGAPVSVIQFWTVYIPNLSIS